MVRASFSTGAIIIASSLLIASSRGGMVARAVKSPGVSNRPLSATAFTTSLSFSLAKSRMIRAAAAGSSYGKSQYQKPHQEITHAFVAGPGQHTPRERVLDYAQIDAGIARIHAQLGHLLDGQATVFRGNGRLGALCHGSHFGDDGLFFLSR